MAERSSRKCVACAFEIPEEARKCVRCGTRQDWRRHLDFGNTSLALLIALLTLLTALPNTIAAIVQLSDNLFRPSSILRIIEINSDTLSVYVANRGRHALLIDGAECMLAFPESSSFFKRYLHARGTSAPIWPTETEAINHIIVAYEAAPRVIEPGASSSYDLQFQHSFVAVEDTFGEDPAVSACVFDLGAETTLEKQNIQLATPPTGWFLGFGLKNLIDQTEVFFTSGTTRERLLERIEYDEDAQSRTE